MENYTDPKLLELNYLEILISYLEGKDTLPTVFKVNERIYKKSPKTLPKHLISVSIQIHELSVRIERGEKIDKETITHTICDVMLDLARPH